MRTKNILKASFLLVVLIGSWSCSGADQSASTSVPLITVSKLKKDLSLQLIQSNSASLEKAGFTTAKLDPETDQIFSVSYKGKEYLVVPVSRESIRGISAFTCSMLLFTPEGKFIGGVDTLGSGEDRPWTCDGVVALGFDRLYPDGSLGIIAIYEGTAPSSERFRLPLVLKANTSPPSLLVDEEKSKLLTRKNISTIKAAKNTLR